MLPTPSTSHVCFDTIYEPAEDSYLFLDTLSSPSEAEWLSRRFNGSCAPPVVLEVGTGSGIVLAFVAANARSIFGRPDILSLGTDANANACRSTQRTVRIAMEEKRNDRDELGSAQLLAAIAGDLSAPIRDGTVDVLIFNPPYVPTPELPRIPLSDDGITSQSASKFERDSHLLSLSYAGGDRGMEITDRFLDSIPEVLNTERGVAYILLCAQNEPDKVMTRVRNWGSAWKVEIVGRSGEKAGWERLVIVRIWKDAGPENQ